MCYFLLLLILGTFQHLPEIIQYDYGMHLELITTTLLESLFDCYDSEHFTLGKFTYATVAII